ncbi:hypothetical protein KHA90_01740 [Flavobacterium psychroterrae]|uniref:Histidine kinase/HSP90-like ATPase domain-containing protein n=1 Tax=Flavobacterium psychroterrae TaxID=2133767 RepID=A0ABS5P794_9FLAO|nr:hypothetical protein [Flavobacterium psychroterrae]MBS7229733.1 hypothetical protein [Flavobacterium psychroterrae]
MEYKKTIRLILGNRKLTVVNQINQIKILINAGEYKQALKSHPIFNKSLNKDPFFKSIENIFLKEPYSFTENFKKEFKWITNILENYLNEIDSFIVLKNKFEECIILDNFENASDILKDIENLFGISLWSIEANLIIEERVNNSESNWNKLSYYLKEIKKPIYEFTINSSSKRIESKFSFETFLNQFQNEIDTINAEGLIKDFLVFKNFNIVNYDYKYKNLESVIYVSNIFSIIDQYLILIDVILYNLATSVENDKLFFPFINLLKDNVPNDYRIWNIYNVINEKKELLIFENNNDILQCLNLYYSGDFEGALEISRIGIKTHPLEYEYYKTYCKSLINLEIDFVQTGLSKTIDEILKNTYDLLTFKNDKEKSWKDLLKSTLFLMNTNFGKQITGLMAEIEGKIEKNHIIGFLSSSFNSHKNLALIGNRNLIVENFKDLFSNHSFKVQYFKQGNDVKFLNSISKSKLQESTFEAIRSYQKEDFNKVIEILAEASDLDNLPYYYERKVSLLFYSFLNLGLLKEALNLFGEIFFNKTTLTRKLSYIDLYEEIKETRNKDFIIDSIEYPILYSLIVKEYDLYEAYDDFMCSINIFSIEEIDVYSFIEKYTLEKVVYFLSNVITIDTLKYSTEYNSISDVEEDRVKILEILISVDLSNKLIYEKEINEIYKINSVRKVLKEVDEGRLYIDVSSLKEIQIKNFSDQFQRFKEIEASSSTQNLIGFNTSNTKNWEKALTEKNDNIEEYNSANYLAFKSIYLESRENFLFSKEYGLDSCLSTRIRHGALKNHIRSVFEKLNLITSKINNQYKDNNIWRAQLVSTPELNIPVQLILKNFSKEIDDNTTFIVEKLIQIQTEKNSDKAEGLFQYYTNDELLYSFYNEAKEYFDSVESTIEMILTNFVNYTLINLQEDIVHAFSSTIPKKFQLIIENTIGELRNLNLPNECELISNLTKSSTEIQNELQYLSEWFYLNTTSSSSLLNIETIIDASLNLTNRINPLFNLKPEINVKNIFAGYSNLIFVFNIMFKNVIEHSKLDTNKIKLRIDSSIEKDEFVLIKFTNNLNPNFDYSANRIKLEAIKENWNNHENIERSNKEGESGYDKIKRILLYEALAKTHRFDYELNKNSISITLYFPYKKPIA